MVTLQPVADKTQPNLDTYEFSFHRNLMSVLSMEKNDAFFSNNSMT